MFSAVARIDAGIAGKGASRGTGFLVGDCLALTAFHVVADRAKALTSSDLAVRSPIVLTFPDGSKAEATLIEECWDPRADFALLRLKWQAGSQPPRPLPLSLSNGMQRGTAWHTFGYPDAYPAGLVNEGVLRDWDTKRDGAAAFQLYCEDAAAGNGEPVHGFSGAPILVSGEQDQAGAEESPAAVVGLLRAALMEADGHSMAGALFGCPIACVLKMRRIAEQLPVPDPCFGLPGLPRRNLPEKPYKYLTWFTEEEAEIFFGRNREIAQVFRRLTDENEPRILLLYGQAGVGKSSFLDAGLQPRLKWHHEVIYLRRDAGQTLSETLKQKLGAAPGDSLASAWQAKEAKDGRPLMMIFDQIEEIYTRPSKGAPQELAQFCAELTSLYPEQGALVRGRLVLSFRKEWYAELQKVLEASRLGYSKVFLQTLDKPPVMEAILGLTKTERLVNKYGLQITPALAEMMADTLLADDESPIAPTLQILLTKMWDKAYAVSRSSPQFTLEDFVALKTDGLGLGDFLDQQLADLKTAHPDWVDSGLALDVLDQHVTPSLTAKECSLDGLLALYKDRGNILPNLLQGLKDQALLVDTSQDNDWRVTRLCHDTLALQVRQRYAASDKPGQRARRILENHMAEWKEGSGTGSLDSGTLATVESGLGGMRVPTSNEEKLIAYSRKHRWYARTAIWGGLFAIVVAGAWGWWQKIGATHQAQIAQARLAVNESSRWLGTDQARALMLAVSAIGQSSKLNDPQVAKEARENLPAILAEAREENSISTLSPESAYGRGALAISSQGVIATGGSRIRLWTERGSPLDVQFDTPNQPIDSLAFSPDGNMLATCTHAGQIQIWEVTGGARGRPFSPGGICMVAFAEGGNMLVSYTPKTGDLSVWSLDGRQMWEKTVAKPLSTGDFPGFGNAVSLFAVQQMVVGRQASGNEVIVANAGEGSIGVWDLSGKPVTKPFKVGDNIASIAIDDHGGQLMIITAGQDSEDKGDGLIGFWGIDGKPSRAQIRVPRSQLRSVQVGRHGSMLAITLDGIVHFTDLNGADYFTPVRTGSGFEEVAFDPIRPQAAVRDVTGQMKLLDLAPPYAIRSREIAGQAVAFSPTNSVLAVGTSEGLVDLESVGENQVALMRRLTGPAVTDGSPGIERVVFDSDGRRIAAINGSTRIRVWDIDGELLEDSPPVTNYGSGKAGVYGLRFSGVGVLYATDAGVYLRDPQTGREQQVLKDLNGRYAMQHPVTLSPDGKTIAAGLKDNTVRIWDLIGRQLGPSLQLSVLPWALAYSSDGSKLVVEKRGGVIQAWPLKDGTFASLSPLSGQILGNFKSGTAVLSPRNDFLFLDQNEQVTMWSIDSGQNIAQFPPGTPVKTPVMYPIAVSADGETMASSEKGEVHLWRSGWHGWLDSLCARLRFNSILNPANDSPEDRQNAVTAKDTCQKLAWSQDQ